VLTIKHRLAFTFTLLLSVLAFTGCGGGGGDGGSASGNANLSSLSLSSVTLDQVFSPSLTTYSASVANTVSSTSVTPTQEDDNASSLGVNGALVTSGTASSAIALAVGMNTINVVVTAEDGVTQKTYTITITRASAFSSRSREPVIFLADKETDRITELYAAFDDGTNTPVKLSETLTSSGIVMDFAVSPNKAFVAYLANQDTYGIYELYVVPVNAANNNYKTGNAYKVSGTLSSLADVKSFAWAPDSSRLIFLADVDVNDVDELYMVNSDGNNLRKINGSVSGVVEIGEFAWSSDSRYVAYKVYNQNNPAEVIGINSHDSQANAAGDPGFSVRLNPSLAAGRSLKSFAWAGNSNRVAYRADQNTTGQDELYISTASVSQTSTKMNHALGAGNSVTEFAWAPDDSYLVYVAETAGGNGLFSSDFTGTLGTSLSSATQIVSFQWATDSQRIAYIAANPDQVLFASTPDGTSIDSMLSGVLTTGGNVKRFQWSPDASTVAYLADQDSDEVFELYISKRDGSLTGAKVSDPLVSEGDVQAFAWSPDSNLLAYRADATSTGIDALYTSHVGGDWTGSLISATSLPTGNDIGVFSFAWASDSGALTYHASETTSGVVELYSSLADGGVSGTLLSGTLVDRGDVYVKYGYDTALQPLVTNHTKLTNLFKDGSFAVPGTTAEMCGTAYDPIGDALFIVQCVHVGPSKILKYSFDKMTVATVFEYESQWDYGLRLINNELWLVRTYDEGFDRFTGLQDKTLTLANAYFDGANLDALNEIYDLALSEGDLYIVAGNPLTSAQHNGIQRIDGSSFNSVTELVSEATAQWPSVSVTFVYSRSIISVGTGATARLIVATGPDGDIERWDLSGNFINAVPGLGDRYLQKDSQDRIYTFADNVSVNRWAAGLDSPETFNIESVNQYSRFVLRERDSNIEIITTGFRSREPRFNSTTVPK